MEQLLEYNIENVLFDGTKASFAHHHRIASACAELQDCVMNVIRQHRNQKIVYGEKIQSNVNTISNTSLKAKNIEIEISNVVLQQKVMDKQVSNVLGQEEQIKEEITKETTLKENLALEIVDLEQKREEEKARKKNKWDTVKRACAPYKAILQIFITINDISEAQHNIRVRFFHSKFHENDEYYADLIQTVCHWRVDTIQPPLQESYKQQLRSVVNFDNQCEVTNITAFLCLLRRIFQQLRTIDTHQGIFMVEAKG